MQSNRRRYGLFFILLHWLLAGASVTLLGLGWYLRFLPEAAENREFLAALHASLGLWTAILLVLALLTRLVSGAPPHGESFPLWRRAIGAGVHALLYLALIALLASGYLREALEAGPMAFWSVPLPAWLDPDLALAQRMAAAHGLSAYLLLGLIVVHVAFVAANGLRRPGFVRRMLPGEGAPVETAGTLLASSAAVKIAQRLAGRLRLFGWLQFWAQFLLGFLAALLLQFATSGKLFASLSLGFGDASYWGAASLALLAVACALGFDYTRLGRRVELAPERYLAAGVKGGFWRLVAGAGLSLVGLVIAFVGVGLSIFLLIAKTVSQPPGIAITDPNKIIRALDVFVLLVNFSLLIAHFIGLGAAQRLRLQAGRARRDYVVALLLEAPPELAAVQPPPDQP
jgi:cytochrome b561